MNKKGHKTYGEDLIAQSWILNCNTSEECSKKWKEGGQEKEKWKIHEKNELYGKECKTNVFR